MSIYRILSLTHAPIEAINHEILREEFASAVLKYTHNCALIVETFITELANYCFNTRLDQL